MAEFQKHTLSHSRCTFKTPSQQKARQIGHISYAPVNKSLLIMTVRNTIACWLSFHTLDSSSCRSVLQSLSSCTSCRICSIRSCLSVCSIYGRLSSCPAGQSGLSCKSAFHNPLCLHALSSAVALVTVQQANQGYKGVACQANGHLQQQVQHSGT
jgi:hypothetical protein